MPDPGILEALCINLRAYVTGLRQVIKHLPRRHVTRSLALKSCFSFRGSHFALPRASPLAFHWLLIALALRRRFLAHRDRRGVTTDMSDDALSQRFFDQGLMHPPCEVALGKLSKGPRKGGFTRYFAGKYPSAQVPQPGVDLKAFEQGPRGRHVPHCFCQKGPRQINPIS